MASSSLGALTLDLIARVGGFIQGMDKAARHSDKKTKEMQRQWRDVRRFIMQVGSALGVAFSARAFQQMISNSANLIDSLAKTASAIGVPIERLQALGTIAELTGTNADQLSVNLERMQRRLGELARGGGKGTADALADIGLNIKEIVNLSADRQLEEIAKAFASVENATVRASIANDLFGRDGVRMLKLLNHLSTDGLQPMQNELERLGFLLTSEGAARVEQMNDSLTMLGKFSQGVSQQMTVALAPAIQAVAWSLTDAAKESGGFRDEFEAAADKIIRAAAFIQDAIAGFGIVMQATGRGMAVVLLSMELGLWQLADAIVNGPINSINTLINLMNRVRGVNIGSVGPMFERPTQQIAMLKQAIEEGVRDIDEGLMRSLPGSGLIERYEKAKQQAEEAGRKAGERFSAAFDVVAGKSKGAKKVVDEAARELQRLMDAGKRVYEETRTPIEQLGLRIEELNVLLEVGAITWDTYARAIFKAQEDFDKTTESFKRMQSLMEAGKRVFEETRNPAEILAARIEHLNELVSVGAIDWDTYARAVTKAQEEFSKSGDKMSEFAVQAARNIQTAFADFLFDPFESSLRDMASNFARTLHRMVSELLAQQILLSFFGMMGGGNAGSIWTAMAGGIAGARAEGGPVSPGKAYLVGERGPELFVPNTAGNVQANGTGGVRIINVIDPNLVADYMAGSGGDRVVLNVLERNRSTVRQMVVG
jgi:hypothetical protein